MRGAASTSAAPCAVRLCRRQLQTHAEHSDMAGAHHTDPRTAYEQTLCKGGGGTSSAGHSGIAPPCHAGLCRNRILPPLLQGGCRRALLAHAEREEGQRGLRDRGW